MLLLVTVNACFVAAEFAIVRVRRTRLTELADHGVAAAKHSIACVDEMAALLSTTQIGVTMASLGVGWIAESSYDRVFSHLLPGDWGPMWAHALGTALAFALVTFTHVLLGETVPKNLAIERAEQLMLAVARPLLAVHRVLAPVRVVMVGAADRLLRIFTGDRPTPSPISEKELQLIMADSHAEGVITRGEAQIIARAFEFSDRRARDVMIGADRVDYFSLEREVDENLALAKRSRRARLPLCRAGLDTAFAVVSMKDAWPLLLEQPSNLTFAEVARPLPQVREDATQDEVLALLQVHRTQLALVRGMDDRTAVGIVTLEDVLESLHGDVREAPLGGPVR